MDSYVAVFYDWNEKTRILSDAEFGRLMRAIIEYGSGIENAGERLKGGREEVAFQMLKVDIDRDKKKRAINIENGTKPKTQKRTEANRSESKRIEANRSELKRTEANQSETDKEKEKEKEDYHPQTPSNNEEQMRINEVFEFAIKSGFDSDSTTEQIFNDLYSDYGYDTMMYAIRESVESGAKTLRYLRKVLENKRNGISKKSDSEEDDPYDGFELL